MRAARSGIVLAATLLLAACGGGNERRDAVNDYFDRVNQAQAALVNQSASIQNALRVFSLNENGAAEIRSLRRAQTVLEQTRTRIDELDPPADAKKLHADLVLMLDLEATVTKDLVWSSQFVPQLTKTLRPLAPAGKRLARDLRAASGWDAQAAAFERYRAALVPVLAKLERLSAPPELRASLVGERTLVRRSIALCGEIAAGLRKRDVVRANAAIRDLSRLAVGDVAIRARRGQIAASRAYNKRLRRISDLSGRIVRERLRLVTEIG